METSLVLFLSICQKHLTLLVTRAFLISCRFIELTIRSFIGILIICFLERNQSNSELFCQMPYLYFLGFHREVYWERYCLLSILMMCIRSSVNLSHHLCGYDTVIFTAARDLESIQSHLSEDCHNLSFWFRDNELVLNLK